MNQNPSKKFKAQVVSEEVASMGVKKITLKVEGNFSYFGWEYIWLEIPELKMGDTKGNRRAFSILNYPRADGTIDILVRTSEGGYKQTLFSLKKGDQVFVHGPFGSTFRLDKECPNNIIMLAGGVGIAAFYPVLEYIKVHNLTVKCYLVYLNKNPEETPLLKELKQFKSKNSWFDYGVSYEFFKWSDVGVVFSGFQGVTKWWISGTQGMVDFVFKELENGGVSVVDMMFENFYPTNPFQLTREAVLKQLTENNLFAQAIENSTNHTIITDVNGVVLFANKSAEDITGFTREEMLGNTPRLWGGLMSPEFYKEFWRKKSTGEAYVGGITNRKKNGDIYHAIAHIAPIFGKDKNIIGYIGTEEDITDRVIADQKTAESKNFLDSIVENLPNMVFVKDAKDLKFELLNKAGEELLGLKREELSGKNDFDFFPKEQAQFFVDNDRKVLNDKKLADIKSENINTKNKGQRILHTKKIPVLDAQGNPAHLLGISEDITEASLREQEIERLNERVTIATESAKMGIWEWDIATNNLVWSDQMYKLFGLEKGKVKNLYESWHNAIHPDDKVAKAAEMQAVIEGKKEYDFSFRIIWPSGEVRYLRAFGRIKKSGAQASPVMLAISWDITEDKMHEIEIESKNEELQKLNDLMVNRELKMIEMKKEIARLKGKNLD